MKAPLSFTLCLVVSSVAYAEINVGFTVEWLSHQSSLIAKATPINVEDVKGTGDVRFTKTRFRLDEVIKGPQSAGDTVTIYDFSYNKTDVLGLFKAKQYERQLLVFATVAQHLFKQIDTKYVLTVTRKFKSAYFPAHAIKKLFTPNFTCVLTFDELLKRTKVQVEHEANLKHRYWKGTIVKKSLEVPVDAEAHRYLYAGSTCYLWLPEYKEKKNSNK